MTFTLSQLRIKALLALSLLALMSCSATQKAIKYRKLDVQTKMSETIFLDPLEEQDQTVYLQIRNTTDKDGLNIKSQIEDSIRSKGYKIVSSPKKANIMIQANILQVGRTTQEDPFNTLTGGYGSALGGFVTGAAISGATGGSNRNMAGVGLAVGAASFLADSLVDVVSYSMITDLQISEKGDGEIVTETSRASLKQGTSGSKTSSYKKTTSWKKYQTRVVSVARKVNLKFEVAEPELTKGLAKSVSGIL